MSKLPQNIVILGATSAIAMATAKQLARDNTSFFLVARDADKLAPFAADLQIRTRARVSTLASDLADTTTHAEILRRSLDLGRIDLVLVAYGILGDQAAAEKDFATANQILHTNFISTVSLLTVFANTLEQQKSGTIAVISSVAGDRGRQSNYIYGASKGALDVFLQGLRNRLFRSGVRVLTIKPGFVATPMTAHVPQNKLFATPDAVARVIVRAVASGKDVVYAPGFWRLIMAVIRRIPEPVFKRLKL